MARDYTDKSKAFYNSRAWIRTRTAFMQSKNYICERCGGLAVIVHHKEHINSHNIHDVNITLNWDNFQAVCVECHNAVHGIDMVCREDVQFNADGQLVERRLIGTNDLLHAPVRPQRRGVSYVFK